MKHNGFSVVPYIYIKAGTSEEMIRNAVATMDPKHFAYPVDGLIMEYEDIAYGKSLGATGHHENRLIAFKWEDELHDTKFLGVELATTRTGMVSITGIFDPVVIDGTEVSRAYLHNLDKNWSGLSSLVQTMAGWNKNGVPAVVVGIVFQIFAFLKLKDGVDSFLVLGGIGLAANIVGIVAFTVLFSLILYIVQGAIAFIMRYLVIILLIVVGFLWLKKKLFG